MTQDLARRTRLSHDERRRRLVEIGIVLLGERSSWKLTAREVAERAGISVGLLYHYFPGVRPLYLASLKELSRRLAQATEWPPGGGPARGLRASLAAQVRFAASRPGAWRALCGAGSPADPEVRAILRELRCLQVDRVRSGLGGGTPSERTRLRLEGWLGFCEAAIGGWLDAPGLREAELVEILAGALPDPTSSEAFLPVDRRRGRKPRVRLVAAVRPTPPA